MAVSLEVDQEDLSGNTKTDLARKLALHRRRRGWLGELEEVVRGETAVDLSKAAAHSAALTCVWSLTNLHHL
jgi:hypothetical protein